MKDGAVFFWKGRIRLRTHKSVAKVSNFNKKKLKILTSKLNLDPDYYYDSAEEGQALGVFSRGYSQRHHDLAGGKNEEEINEDEVDESNIIEKYQPLLGEFVWHSITVDESIERISKEHFDSVMQVLSKNNLSDKISRFKILEVACYAHTTGYMLSEKGADVTLFDISAHNLRLGKKNAEKHGKSTNLRRVAGDFHSLPFKDNFFDFVYISSALHHTLNWKKVLTEMIRVLSPQGIIYFDNEPCKREACFYKFRANRADVFTPFEKELYSSGLMRTFAEPYVGSRREQLFGMIENQKIPLYEFLAEIKKDAEIVTLNLSPDIYMGNIERSWIDMKKVTQEKISKKIKEDLTYGVDRAMTYYGNREKGLGFSLPSAAEIDEFCRRISYRIANLPKDKDEHRIALSDLFGSSVRVVLKKKGSAEKASSKGRECFRNQLLYHDDVYYGFTQYISKFLIEESSMLPYIQTDDEKKIARYFPDKEWSLLLGDNGLRSLFMRDNEASILLPNESGKLLLLIRLYLTESKEKCYRLTLSYNGKLLYTYDAWQSDSILFTGIITLNSRQTTRLIVKRFFISEEDNVQERGNIGSVNIGQAFAFKI